MSKAKIAAGLGAAAVALAMPVVMHFEGLSLTPYKDPVGIPTVCFGETHAEMRSYTQAECRAMLMASLESHGQDIAACLPQDLPDHQKAAALSFGYNVGAQKLCSSTFAAKLRARDPTACAELSRWVCVRGRDRGMQLSEFDRAACPTSELDQKAGYARRSLPGLVKRRAAERAMCEGK